MHRSIPRARRGVPHASAAALVLTVLAAAALPAAAQTPSTTPPQAPVPAGRLPVVSTPRRLAQIPDRVPPQVARLLAHPVTPRPHTTPELLTRIRSLPNAARVLAAAPSRLVAMGNAPLYFTPSGSLYGTNGSVEAWADIKRPFSVTTLVPNGQTQAPTFNIAFSPDTAGEVDVDVRQAPAGWYLVSFDFSFAYQNAGPAYIDLLMFESGTGRLLSSRRVATCDAASLDSGRDPQTGMSTCMGLVQLSQDSNFDLPSILRLTYPGGWWLFYDAELAAVHQ